MEQHSEPTSAPAAPTSFTTVPTWTRMLLVVLGVPNVVTGAWAVMAPHDWYENFPGWAPHLISAFPPYNEHLATDAGIGLLVTGLLALGAAVWPRRDVVLTASAAYAVFALIHAAFHLLTPAADHRLDGAEAAVNNATLVAAAAASAVVVFHTLLSSNPARRTR